MRQLWTNEEKPPRTLILPKIPEKQLGCRLISESSWEFTYNIIQEVRYHRHSIILQVNWRMSGLHHWFQFHRTGIEFVDRYFCYKDLDYDRDLVLVYYYIEDKHV